MRNIHIIDEVWVTNQLSYKHLWYQRQESRKNKVLLYGTGCSYLQQQYVAIDVAIIWIAIQLLLNYFIISMTILEKIKVMLHVIFIGNMHFINVNKASIIEMVCNLGSSIFFGISMTKLQKIEYFVPTFNAKYVSRYRCGQNVDLNFSSLTLKCNDTILEKTRFCCIVTNVSTFYWKNIRYYWQMQIRILEKIEVLLHSTNVHAFYRKYTATNITKRINGGLAILHRNLEKTRYR